MKNGRTGIRKENSIDKEELMHTNRSRSEGSTRREKEAKRLTDVASDFISNKICIRENYDGRRKDFIVKAKLQDYKGGDNQMIYTFRENNEGTENGDDILDKIDTSFRTNNHYHSTLDYSNREKVIKMNRSDLFQDSSRYNTITRNNEAFAETLLSLKKGSKEFNNTEKYIENMNSSDLNIIKNFNRTNDTEQFSGMELNSSSTKHRSISTKRVSRTERRDGVKSKPRKTATINAEDVGIDKDPQGIQTIAELQKKYAKLKRHYKKEKKYYQTKLDNLSEQNKSYVYQITKLEGKAANAIMEYQEFLWL